MTKIGNIDVGDPKDPINRPPLDAANINGHPVRAVYIVVGTQDLHSSLGAAIQYAATLPPVVVDPPPTPAVA